MPLFRITIVVNYIVFLNNYITEDFEDKYIFGNIMKVVSVIEQNKVTIGIVKTAGILCKSN
jgi:hypothetical protein